MCSCFITFNVKKRLLGDESIARAKSLNVFKTKNLNFLITSGWAYRSD